MLDDQVEFFDKIRFNNFNRLIILDSADAVIEVIVLINSITRINLNKVPLMLSAQESTLL